MRDRKDPEKPDASSPEQNSNLESHECRWEDLRTPTISKYVVSLSPYPVVTPASAQRADGSGASLQPSVLCGSPESIQPAESQTNQTDCLQEAPNEDPLAAFSSSQHLTSQDPSPGKKSNDPKSFTPTSHLKEADEERLQRDSGSPKSGICLENSMPSNEKQDVGGMGALTCTTVTEVGSKGFLPGTECGTKAEKAGIQRLLASSPRGTIGDTVGRIWQEWEVPSISGEPQVLQSLGTSKDFITEKSQEPARGVKGTRKEEPAAVALQAKAEVRK